MNFAGMCWRIVRIEGDGSVKLILEDKNEQCNDKEGQDLNNNGTYFTGNWSGGEDDYYVFGYDDNYRADFLNYRKTDGLQHSFKTFQTNNLTSADIEKLKVDEWCYDDETSITIGYGWDENGTYTENKEDAMDEWFIKEFYGAYNRIIFNETPSLKCSGT